MDIRTLEQRQNKLLVDAQALLFANEGKPTAEQRESANQMIAEANVITGDIQNLRNIEQALKVTQSFERSPRPGVSGSSELPVEERKARFNKVFRQYARHGYQSLNEEQRALLTTSDVTGGALIPQEFAGVLIEARKFYGAIADKVENKVTNNNGAPMKYSFSNDTANGLTLLATEGTSGPVETDPGFQSKIVSVDTVTGGLVKVSFQELEDSAFDLDSFLRKSFGIRYGRGLEQAITLGKDSAGTVLPNQAAGGLLGMAAVGTTTATLAAGIGWTDLTTAFGALDAAYLGPNTAWVFNTSTRATLLGMKDGFGRPFWTPDPSADGPFSKLLGFDVVLDQAMPNIGGANATPILFGDLQAAYLLRTDGQPSILRLNERFADTLEVGFYLYTRIGGMSKDAGITPAVVIKQAAS